ncbi:hypothetical protein V6N13_125700 [Hibiscus sabdariffa]
MRMSCNGCRVLRKGCTQSCSIRPCLHWIPNSLSQANATLFLAKFYGRAGLLNLIDAALPNLRPGVFKSLLYEACGRIVDPVHGSVGLMCSGNWHLCEAAVDAVLSGAPVKQVPSQLSASKCPSLKSAFDIRHVSKEKKSGDGLRKVKSRGRFKPKEEKVVYEPASRGGISGEGDCLSAETVEESLAKADEFGDGSDLELELTLGLPSKRRNDINGRDDATCGGRVDV